MAYDPDNIFAKILRGEAPCHKVYEDDATLAFLDIMPQAKGHTLVIPKAGSADIFGLSPDALAATIKTTQKLAAVVKDVVEAPGLMVAQLNGAEAGQTVFHLHFHIIPRWDGIDLKLHAREMADQEELKALAQKIIARLG